MDPSITIQAAAEILAGMVSMYNPVLDNFVGDARARTLEARRDKRRMKIATVNPQNQDGYTLLDNFVTSGESFDEIVNGGTPPTKAALEAKVKARMEIMKKRPLAMSEEGKENADGATNKRRRITRYTQNTLQAITNNPVRTLAAGALMVGGALGLQAFSVLSPVPL